MKKILLLFILLSGPLLRAQLNESDTMKFQLRAGLTGNYQRGNVRVFTVRGRGDGVWRAGAAFVFKSQNSALYQSFSGVKADNDLFSRNYLYYQPAKRVYPFGIAYISSGYRRKINSRYFAGLGATLQLVRRQWLTLKYSASVVYEQTLFRERVYNFSHYNGQQRLKTWRATLYTAGNGRIGSGKLRYYFDAFWQSAFADAKNYRVQADAGIELPVYRGLSFTASCSYFHEHLVVSSVRRDDTILGFGISYQWQQARQPIKTGR